MKRFFKSTVLIFLLGGLLPLTTYGQYSLIPSTYLQLHQNSLELDMLISMCAEKGNLPAARNELSTVFDKNTTNYLLGSHLLSYQLFGRDSTFRSLDGLHGAGKIDEETWLFSKAWLSYITQNGQDAEAFSNALQAKFPQSEWLLKMALKRHLDYVHSNVWNKDPEQKKRLLMKIDSLLQQEKLPEDQEVYYTLARFDVQKGSRFTSGALEDSINKVLCDLWERFPAFINAFELDAALKSCGTQICMRTRKKLKQHIYSQLELSPERILYYGLADTIRRYQEIREDDARLQKSIPLWERHFGGLIDGEKDPERKEKMKAMICAASSPIACEFYDKYKRSMGKEFATLPYSASFKEKLKPELSAEEMEALLLSELKSFEEAIGQKMPERQADEKPESIENLFFTLGYMGYSGETMRAKQDWFQHLTKIRQDAPGAEDRSSWKAFQVFLTENPFYQFDVLRMAQVYAPEIREKSDLDSAFFTYQEVIARYTACVNLHLQRIALLHHYVDYYDDRNAYAKELISAVMALFAVNQNEGIGLKKEKKLEDYFTPHELFWDEEYQKDKVTPEKLLTYLSKQEKKEFLKQIDTLLEKRPGQENLLSLRSYIDRP